MSGRRLTTAKIKSAGSHHKRGGETGTERDGEIVQEGHGERKEGDREQKSETKRERERKQKNKKTERKS